MSPAEQAKKKYEMKIEFKKFESVENNFTNVVKQIEIEHKYWQDAISNIRKNMDTTKHGIDREFETNLI